MGEMLASGQLWISLMVSVTYRKKLLWCGTQVRLTCRYEDVYLEQLRKAEESGSLLGQTQPQLVDQVYSSRY